MRSHERDVGSGVVGRPPADTKQLGFKMPNDLIRQAEEHATLLLGLTKFDTLRMAMARGLRLLLADLPLLLAGRRPSSAQQRAPTVAHEPAAPPTAEAEAEAPDGRGEGTEPTNG